MLYEVITVYTESSLSQSLSTNFKQTIIQNDTNKFYIGITATSSYNFV